MTGTRRAGTLSAAKLVVAAQRLQARGDALELLAAEPIAIIGMGCRFPGGADSPDSFWQLLVDGCDAVGEMSAGRWPQVPGDSPLRRGAYFRAIDEFEPEFFAIAPREAAAIDPQQRLLLEVVWEALADAGQPIRSLAERDAGVFLSIPNTDYARLQYQDLRSMDPYTGIGSAASVAAGRLSYLLDARGPSLAIDAACSSSLAATHLACRSLVGRECALAIVGASSLKVLPDEVLVFAGAGMLSRDGRSRSFDECADGFAPAEGCGVVILKLLAAALADGDRVRAVIRGTAVGNSGRTSTLSAPNGLAEETVMRGALRAARVAPEDVSYIETHALGTALGDAIECEALTAVYGGTTDGPAAHGPCYLGALKTNIGHLEAAAGVAGLIKTTLCLEHALIPSNLHFKQLNGQISFEGTRLALPLETIDWRRAIPRFAAVSAFGFAGAHAHAIVEEAPVLPVGFAPSQTDRDQAGRDQADRDQANCGELLVLSARTEAALRAFAVRYAAALCSASIASLRDVCRSAALRGNHYEHRLAVTGCSTAALSRSLTRYAQGGSDAAVASGEATRTKRPGLVWMFSGDSASGPSVIRELLTFPAFRTTVEECEAAFASISTNDAPVAANLTASRRFTLQLGVAAVLRSWGILPDALVGSGTAGEIAARQVAGLLSLEEAVCRVAAFAASSLAPESSVSNAQDVSAGRAHASILLLTPVSDPRHVPGPLSAFREPPTQNGAHPPDGSLTGGQAIERLFHLGFGAFLEIGPEPAVLSLLARSAAAHAKPCSIFQAVRPDAPADETLLAVAGALYVEGREIDWPGVFPERGRFVPPPLYPWQRRRFPIPEDRRSAYPHAAPDTARETYGLSASAAAALASLSAAKRARSLAAHVDRCVQSVLGLESAQPLDESMPIQELGLDSLLAVALRNVLAESLRLPHLAPTFAFSNPTVGAMTEALGKLLPPPATPSDAARTEHEEIRI